MEWKLVLMDMFSLHILLINNKFQHNMLTNCYNEF